MRLIVLIFMLLLLLCAPVVAGEESKTPPERSTATTSAEAELGRKTAEQIEKEVKLVTDDAAVAKLNAIAADIAPYTQRPDVVYTCKILDDPSINAMAIPGGIIYINKGLLAAVESDDELAGVLAHEISHNSLYHVKRLMEHERTGSIAQIVAVLAAVYVKNNSQSESDVSAIQMITMSEIVKQAILNGYSTELETEADQNAVEYMMKTGKYDPNGLYSVILGFRQMESARGQTGPNYLKNHPDPGVRLDALTKRFQALHIPINVWNVVNFRAKVVPPETDQSGYTVRLGSVDLFTFTAPDGGLDAKARANAAAAAINQRLMKRDSEIQRFDVRSSINTDRTRASVRMRNVTVITLTPSDMPATDTGSLADLAALIKQKIQMAIFNEKIKRGM